MQNSRGIRALIVGQGRPGIEGPSSIEQLLPISSFIGVVQTPDEVDMMCWHFQRRIDVVVLDYATMEQARAVPPKMQNRTVVVTPDHDVRHALIRMGFGRFVPPDGVGVEAADIMRC